MHIRFGNSHLVLNKTYTTHMAVLIKILQMTDGPVAELGSGFFSTPLLHWLCAENRRKLVTYETDRSWDGFLRSFRSRTHSIRYINNWQDIDLKTHWNVIFIDHGANEGEVELESRKASAIMLKDKADYIIMHDTNDKRYTKDFWDNFKYINHWNFATPNTSVVSNFYEIK